MANPPIKLSLDNYFTDELYIVFVDCINCGHPVPFVNTDKYDDQTYYCPGCGDFIQWDYDELPSGWDE